MSDFVAAGSTANGGTQLGQTTPDGGTQLPGGGSSAAPGALPPGAGNSGPVGPNGSNSSNGGTTQQGSGRASGASKPNTPSDAGVTATTINVGNIVTKSGSVGGGPVPGQYHRAAAPLHFHH